jgi:hypothetical protein
MPQWEDFPNNWLKAFEQGTVTPLVMATDATGGTTVAKFELDTSGFPVTAGNARLIPFIDGDYDLWLFPTEAEADANDTTNAIQFADNLNADPSQANAARFDIRYGTVFATVAAMTAANPVSIDGIEVVLVAGMTATVQGFTTAGDGGGKTGLIVASQAADELKDHTAANGTVFVFQFEDSVDVRQCGAIADATLTDSTGTIAGTDNTASFDSALSTGVKAIASSGGYLVSELNLLSDQTLITNNGGWITGPLAKSAIKTGDKDGAAKNNVIIDVDTRHVKIFNDGTVATTKGFPSGALLAGNELTCGVSIENLKKAKINVKQTDGFIGLKSIHAFDTTSTPADVPAGARVEDLRFDAESFGECWTASSLHQVDRFYFKRINAVSTVDNDGIKSLVGFAKSNGDGGDIHVFGGFNGVVVEHECTAINIDHIVLQKQQSNGFVSSKGDQPAGPVDLHVNRIDSINGTSGFEIPTDCVECFDAELSIGVLNTVNASGQGLKATNTSATIIRIGEMYADNTRWGISNAISDIVIDYLEVKDLDIGVVSSGVASTKIGQVRSKGTITTDIVNIGSNGTIEIGDLSGPAGGDGVSLSTSVTARMTGTIDCSQTVTGFVSSTTFSALDLNVIIDENGVKQTYFGPGIYNSAGNGTPEAVVSANKGSEFTRLDAPSQSTLKYYKTTGSGNTGWVAVTLP